MCISIAIGLRCQTSLHLHLEVDGVSNCPAGTLAYKLARVVDADMKNEGATQ